MEANTENSRRSIFNNKRNVLILLGVFLVVIAIVVWYVTIINAKKQEEAYSKRIKSALTFMVDSSVKAEEMGNRYAQAWSAAIEGSYKLNGKTYWTFNSALRALALDSKSEITNLQADDLIAKKTMQELQNPPEKFEAAYDEMTELYKVYAKYVSLCTEPKGSLITYNQQRNELSSDFISLAKSAESKMPNLK